MLSLGRQEHPTHRNGSGESARNVVFGGPHHVEMIGPRVGDDPVSRSDELGLGEPLQMRLKRHAFDDERLGTLCGCHRDGLLLLDHVGAAGAVHRHLAAVWKNEPGNRAGGLAHAANPGLSEPGRDQPRHTRLAACAVHVDSNGNPLEPPAMQDQLEHPHRNEEGARDEKDDNLARHSTRPRLDRKPPNARLSTSSRLCSNPAVLPHCVAPRRAFLTDLGARAMAKINLRDE